MEIQYASDLHLEFVENRKWLKNNPIIPVAPVLILAGDIDIIEKGQVKNPFYFKWLSENWDQVLIIPGNHEFYDGGNMKQAFNYSLEIHSNVRYVNNVSIKINQTEIFLSTLWSNCTSLVENYISDFKLCKWDNQPYNAEKHNYLHKQSVKWIDDAIMNSTSLKKVVVTHFVPDQNINVYPKSSDKVSQAISEYFVADIQQYITKWQVDFWIYGHNHWNNDTQYLNTQFLSNMLGYCGHEENTFNPQKLLEL